MVGRSFCRLVGWPVAAPSAVFSAAPSLVLAHIISATSKKHCGDDYELLGGHYVS